LSALKRHKQINPTIRIKSLNIRSLLYRLNTESIKEIRNHNNHSAVGKNRKCYQFKRKISIHSTIWPSSPLLYHFVNRNGRRFDSVGCLHLFSSRCTRHLYRSHRIAKMSDNNIGQVITQDSFLVIIFLLRQKWKACSLFLQFDKTVCRLFCVNSSKFFGGIFTFFIAIIFHLYSFSLQTFYSI